MSFLLHMVGIFFAIAANISEGFGYESWIQANGLQDRDMGTKYLASYYWAAVTTSTVGYGDITPNNVVEISLGLLLLFSGVAIYSYIVSKLSNLVSSVSDNNDLNTRD